MTNEAHIEKVTTEHGYRGAGTKTGAAITRRHFWKLIAADGRVLESFTNKADAERALKFLPAEFK